MATKSTSPQPLVMASLTSDVEDGGSLRFAPSSASSDDDETNAAATQDHHQPPLPSALPVVTPTDDTKDTILDQTTPIEPPTLNAPYRSNVVASSTSLTKKALPPPANIFPPPSAGAAASATSVYHHPHADGRKKIGLAIKSTATMYGPMSPDAGRSSIYLCHVISHFSPFSPFSNPLIFFVISNSFASVLPTSSHKSSPFYFESTQGGWRQAGP